MDEHEERQPRISRIWAKNFRSIEKLDLELDPLTVLVGPNASGKSNIADVLRFMSDTVRSGLESSLTARRGDQVARRYPSRRKAVDVVIGVKIEGYSFSLEYEFVVRVLVGTGHRVILEKARLAVGETLSETLDIEIRNGRLIKPVFKRPKNMPTEAFDDIDFKTNIESALGEPTNIEFPFDKVVPALFLFRGRLSLHSISQFRRALKDSTEFLSNMRFYHIFPDALREPQIIASKYPLEEHGENLASVLEDMKRKRSQIMPEFLGALSQVVPGVTDVSVTRAGGHLVVKLLHQDRESGGDGIWLDASQESDGTLRTLGLLVALYQDPPPPFIAIEEPELTIHPGALSVLAELILEASQRTSLLITTHSPELLDQLPVESIRSVESIGGATQVGMVAEHQRNAVMKGLFSPGELHRMEGLQLAAKED